MITFPARPVDRVEGPANDYQHGRVISEPAKGAFTMSDENTEQQEQSTTYHELTETPFGGSEPQQNNEQVAAEQEPAEIKQQVAEEPKEKEAESSAQEDVMTMEQAMATAGAGVDYTGTFKSLSTGDVVDGVVVHIDREGVLVDVGTKSEGTVKPNELANDPDVTPEDVVAVGDKIKVYVVQPESQDGGPVLSKKRADFENAWDRVEKAYREKSIIKAMVTDRIKGGLVVDLGIRGFVPASHVGSGKHKNLDKFVGQSMDFKVIEVDRERRKVVLSNREAAEEERLRIRNETLASLREGQIREGIVRRITDYGAFIDLGGVDGLLHVSEMSWTRINHPSEAVKVGQKLQVMVLKLYPEQDRVSLGLRQILPDPWVEIKRMYQVGDVVTGQVSRLVPFGAFVQVAGGVEGIIPNSELAAKRVNKPEEVVSEGQEVEAKIIDLRPDERRMTLSIRQLTAAREKEREDNEYRSYVQTSSTSSGTTIGDLIGGQLGDFASAALEDSEKLAKKQRAKSGRKRVDEKIEIKEAMAELEEMSFSIEAESYEIVEENEELAEPAAEAAVEGVAEPQEEKLAKEEPAVGEPVDATDAASQLNGEVKEASDKSEKTGEDVALEEE